jgi:hypothetical protein
MRMLLAAGVGLFSHRSAEYAIVEKPLAVAAGIVSHFAKTRNASPNLMAGATCAKNRFVVADPGG